MISKEPPTKEGLKGSSMGEEVDIPVINGIPHTQPLRSQTMFQAIRVLKEVSYLLLGIVTLLVVMSRVFGASNTPPMLPLPDLLPPVDERVTTSTVCVCSINGDCTCTPGSNCGCLSETSPQYRWVKTNKVNQVALYKGKEQLGNYYSDESAYKRLIEHGDGSYHFENSPCPVARLPQVTSTSTNHTVSYQPQPSTFVPSTYYQPQQTFQPMMYQPSFNVGSPVFRGNGGGFRSRGSVGGNCGPSG